MTTYSFTGSDQVEVIPGSGPKTASIIMAGAAGGSVNASEPGVAGRGGLAEITFPVMGGQTLTIKVGGKGSDVGAAPGGWPGGGRASRVTADPETNTGGDGGGYTAVRLDGVLMAVVGGGGGEGNSGGAEVAGGDGSADDGADGADAGGDPTGGKAGEGATVGAGGAGGNSNWDPIAAEVTFTDGTAGTSLTGGDGGYFTGTGADMGGVGTLGDHYGGGGGGGGGFFGGGGGGSVGLTGGGGGGGGSGFLHEDVTVVDAGVAEEWDDGYLILEIINAVSDNSGQAIIL